MYARSGVQFFGSRLVGNCIFWRFVVYAIFKSEGCHYELGKD